MIDTVGLYIGGSKVQEYSSDWSASKYQLDQNLDSYEKWSSLIGDVPELFDPASGPYADPATGYPNVVQYPGLPVQSNAPSIPARELNIPLGFFFSESPGLAIPLIGLQYHDVEIRITLRPLRELYTIMDVSGVRTQFGYRLDSAKGTNTYASVWNTQYGPLSESLNTNYVEHFDISGTPRNFLTDLGVTTPISDNVAIQPRLQCTYIYLTEEERRVFASKKLEYMVRQVQEFKYPNISSKHQLQVDAHSLVTRFIWFARRSDWFFRNDYANLTNWKYTDPAKRPYVRAPYKNQTISTTITDAFGDPVTTNTVVKIIQSSSGVLIPGTARNIMTTARILCGGTEIFEEKSANYFSEIMPYRSNIGNGYAHLLNGLLSQTALYPIYSYSFALNSGALQPSGSINTSRISKIDLEVDVQSLPVDANYAYNFTVFAESINFLEIASGLGGMKYSI
jgi:hypothetical protein